MLETIIQIQSHETTKQSSNAQHVTSNPLIPKAVEAAHRPTFRTGRWSWLLKEMLHSRLQLHLSRRMLPLEKIVGQRRFDSPLKPLASVRKG